MAINRQQLNTIKDFGKQWQEYTHNKGFYASLEALESLCSPLMKNSDIKNKIIADVGAGTGRYTLMFYKAGAKKIIALEPSDAYDVLLKNTSGIDEIKCLKKRADEISGNEFDLVFCIGVLQFIPDPLQALKAMRRTLTKKGKLFLWVYSKENNQLYISMVLSLRKLTTRLPHAALKMFTYILLPLAEIYALASGSFKLPMADYMINYFLKVDRYTRRLIIHDQLNPSYVKYYKGSELKGLLEDCGFKDIKMHHRMGYSWSVLAS